MKISVVIATFNRGALLLDLLTDLAKQEDPGDFDVVVVDDGSKVPVRPLVEARSWPYPLLVIEQQNTGQAGARHRGIMARDGEIIVIVDDDMRLPKHFLAAHRACHEQGAEVVLGLMKPAEDLAQKPVFERFHAQQLEFFVESVRRGEPIRGTALCTGNVSFRRARYLEVGGFDLTAKRSEDRELGIRFQKAGCKFVFSERAYTTHHSDHTDRAVWMRRAYLYGVHELRIARRHPEDPRDHPWHYMLLVNPVSRPLLTAAVASSKLGAALSKQAMNASELLDRMGFERIAIKGTTLVFGLEYFRGVGDEYASPVEAAKGFAQFLSRHRSHGSTPR